MASFQEVEQAFWAQVWRCSHRSPCKRCCWPWAPERQTDRGLRRLVSTEMQAHPHRFAVMVTHGALFLPARRLTFVVCHACDYSPCCNPAHLWVGTQGDNIRDARDKGWFIVRRSRPYAILPDGSRHALRAHACLPSTPIHHPPPSRDSKRKIHCE